MRYSAFLLAMPLCVSLSHASHTQAYTTSVDTVLVVGNTNASLGKFGIAAKSAHGVAVDALAADGIAVTAVSTNNSAISASTPSGNPAVTAASPNGTAIYGIGYNGMSVEGTDIGGDGVFAQADGSYGTGVYAFGNTGVHGVGVDEGGGTGSEYGVWGEAAGQDYSYGIYGDASGSNIENWAGYFTTDVYIGGTLVNPSDIMFKKNVRPLDGGLAKIMALKPRNYEMKVDEFKGRVSLPKGKQYGLIAQDLETVMPELVHSVTTPVQLTKEEIKNHVKKEPTHFKSVNYQALIPILVEAIQEQQAEIAALKAGK